MKKITAIIVSLVMIFSLSTSVFAVDGSRAELLAGYAGAMESEDWILNTEGVYYAVNGNYVSDKLKHPEDYSTPVTKMEEGALAIIVEFMDYYTMDQLLDDAVATVPSRLAKQADYITDTGSDYVLVVYENFSVIEQIVVFTIDRTDYYVRNYYTNATGRWMIEEEFSTCSIYPYDLG